MLDITPSRKMEGALRERNEALESADKAKTAFLSRMSYELRTPLTSIGGFGELLQAGSAGKLGDQPRAFIAAIMESVDRKSAVSGKGVIERVNLGGGRNCNKKKQTRRT